MCYSGGLEGQTGADGGSVWGSDLGALQGLVMSHLEELNLSRGQQGPVEGSEQGSDLVGFKW